jgi:hypothetical protein
MQAMILRLFSRILISSFIFAAFCAVPALAVDVDCDGSDDVVDNCPSKWNPSQDDADMDGLGNRCDPDKDGDLIANDDDNCPKAANDEQLDGDMDGVGDACDACDGDPGEDAIDKKGCTIDQLCPCDGPEPDRAWKKHRKYFKCVKHKAKKFKRKGWIDRYERRAVVSDARESTCGDLMPGPTDNDGDGVTDLEDNCPSDPNPSQRNTDDDAFGDACDTDKDDDGVLNGDDSCPRVANGAGQDDDADGDGRGDACDACADTAADDVTDRHGCSIAQECPCEAQADGTPWKDHGKYYRCVRDEAKDFKSDKLITQEEYEAIRAVAKTSECGVHDGPCE